MKKLFTLGIAFIFVLTTACDDFIEVEPKGPVAETYFNSAEDYDKALIGAYDLLQATFWGVQTAVIASPDIIAGGDPLNYDQPTLQDVDKMKHTQSTYVQIRDIWQLAYAGMNRANYLLEFKDKMDFDGKDNIIGQAYFLRAYYAFELAKFFGDIPLLVDTGVSPNRIVNKRVQFGDQFEVDRASGTTGTSGTPEAAYALIAEDLKEAIAMLPATQSRTGAATKGAAQALLGKVYLYHATYDSDMYAEAAAKFDDVIKSNQYRLLSHGAEFNGIWETSAENGPESVFEVQYTSVEGAGWDCIICSEGTYMPKFNNPRDFADPNSKYSAGWGFSLPTPMLYDAFKAGDSRRDLTIFDVRSLSGGGSDYNESREHTGFYTKKYLVHSDNDADRNGSDPLNFDNNYRSIRYADVLLMAAEAEAKATGGDTNAAIDYLNQVRARAFGDNSQDYTASEGDLADAILNERRLELAAEGHYFFDLVRTGKAKAAFDVYNAWAPAGADFQIQYENDKNEFLPIPLVELELANALDRWGQNQGY
jgi:hypothetical protein